MYDEGDLRSMFPALPWDEPVQVHVIGRPAGRWVCRYCIALHGIKAKELYVTPFAFDTRQETLRHIDKVHHDLAGA